MMIDDIVVGVLAIVIAIMFGSGLLLAVLLTLKLERRSRRREDTR